jgi:hypothetical protein
VLYKRYKIIKEEVKESMEEIEAKYDYAIN